MASDLRYLDDDFGMSGIWLTAASGGPWPAAVVPVERIPSPLPVSADRQPVGGRPADVAAAVLQVT